MCYIEFDVQNTVNKNCMVTRRVDSNFCFCLFVVMVEFLFTLRLHWWWHTFCFLFYLLKEKKRFCSTHGVEHWCKKNLVLIVVLREKKIVESLDLLVQFIFCKVRFIFSLIFSFILLNFTFFFIQIPKENRVLIAVENINIYVNHLKYFRLRKNLPHWMCMLVLLLLFFKLYYKDVNVKRA